ncbi:tol protein [Fusarium langsethiae]|uniref:Tol protein n=1 Tax=Fusarium langsethiae TaxID=179993 RepID=A0A0M9EMC6_FUSLA|nr:tol protein [Fusarium langsethiae]
MSHGMELTRLPRTIRDLVEVSRRIGYQYLWIDELCIIQDDPNDRSDQVYTMADFYKGAEILISAASASHSGEGFLQRRTIEQSYGNVFELPYQWKLSDEPVQGSLLLSDKNLNCGLDKLPLDMRIWTF